MASLFDHVVELQFSATGLPARPNGKPPDLYLVVTRKATAREGLGGEVKVAKTEVLKKAGAQPVWKPLRKSLLDLCGRADLKREVTVKVKDDLGAWWRPTRARRTHRTVVARSGRRGQRGWGLGRRPRRGAGRGEMGQPEVAVASKTFLFAPHSVYSQQTPPRTPPPRAHDAAAAPNLPRAVVGAVGFPLATRLGTVEIRLIRRE